MGIPNSFVLESLLQHNYLPMQRRFREEMPPLFFSTTFTADVAKKLISVKQRKNTLGWDVSEYRATKFNGVPRIFSIPHPMAYAHLCLCIAEHWQKISWISNISASIIRPREHRDGRLIIMDYENSLTKGMRASQLSFGQKFTAHTDIANCFPSIYSHAIAWACVGFSHAKSHKPPKYAGEWFNQLDEKTRWNKRNETQGVLIGPATSNILSEIILAKIDQVMQAKYTHERFIDDYTAYCETREQAQEFVLDLSRELEKYKMTLNTKKTTIQSLPKHAPSDWRNRISLAVNSGFPINIYQASNIIDMAIGMAGTYPDESVLKYAVKSLLNSRLQDGVKVKIFPKLVNLAFHQPSILPFLDSVLKDHAIDRSFLFKCFSSIILENVRLQRSDGICWSLYYLHMYGIEISNEVRNAVLASRDCFAICMLTLNMSVETQSAILGFIKTLDASDLYELDTYWILYYRLFCLGHLPNPYSDDETFELLKSENVEFLR